MRRECKKRGRGRRKARFICLVEACKCGLQHRVFYRIPGFRHRIAVGHEADGYGTSGRTVDGDVQIDFLTDLFEEAKRRGISTVLDTAAQPFTRTEPFFSKFERLMKSTDLILLDIKHIDDEKHRYLTGCPNVNILDCARYLHDIGKPVWIRYVLVPGYNDSDEDLTRTYDFIRTLRNVRRVEVLPYHTLGVFKWEEMGIPYTLRGVDPPTEESVMRARKILSGFTCRSEN